MEFKKSAAKYGEPMERGTWLLHPDLKMPVICCPGCGRLGLINYSSHTVDPNGSVSPSLVCPSMNDGCVFHEWGGLLDWKGGT